MRRDNLANRYRKGIINFLNMKKIEGNIVDIYRKKIIPGFISIENGIITSIFQNGKKYDHYIIPGFVDSHVHIESSMLTPVEFSKLVIRRGTIAVINDPHEIANVLGKKGIRFMIENAKDSLIKIFFTIPSCVPSTIYDFSGEFVTSDDIGELIESGDFIGLSEMMNIPGIICNDPEVMQKIEMIRKYNLPIDGHAPSLRGEDLRKYVEAGISTDHECTTLEEALEKISLGMKILIREGSAAKNYESLKSLIISHPDQVMFCTDDSHPGDLLSLGHIDKMVKRAVADGFDLFDVLKIATINPVLHYGLKVGTLRKGETADFAIVKDLVDFEVLSVFVEGKERYNLNSELNSDNQMLSIDYSDLNKFEREPILVSELKKSVEKDIICIGVIDGEIVTKKEYFSIQNPSINLESDLEQDILKIVYLNRYRNTKPQIAYIHGIGLNKGAFATSISHDSHNIIAVGCNDQDLACAINTIILNKGGLSICDSGEISFLSLPIGGIMTFSNGIEVAQIWDHLIEKLHAMGCYLSSPFMTLSFMALIVIPELKIGEKGLFEYSKFHFLSDI